jgi:hypothetical protein
MGYVTWRLHGYMLTEPLALWLQLRINRTCERKVYKMSVATGVNIPTTNTTNELTKFTEIMAYMATN